VTVRILSYSLLYLFLSCGVTGVFAGQTSAGDPLLDLVRSTTGAIAPASEGVYRVPNGRELQDWTAIVKLFRGGNLDSCGRLLARHGYALTSVRDRLTGNTVDVMSELRPVRRGWGTLLFNRGGTKDLIVHVNHPVEDGNATVIGTELFRRSGAKWMLIAGSSKHAAGKNAAADPARAPSSVFQTWHEAVSGPGQVAVSLHAYNPEHYPFPITASDIIISNGRTSDEQWGVSQLSMDFRDSLRAAGFHAALAMMDSGFARLSGGNNPQGVYTNDNAGFGRWMNIELAADVRYGTARYLKFISVAAKVLDPAPSDRARRDGDSFGLVSPRVVKVDRANRLLFPPPKPEKYRIVSFTPGETKNDTLDLLFGNWFDGAQSGKTIARILEDDSTGTLAEQLRRRNEAARAGHSRMTGVISTSPGKYPSGMLASESERGDSLRDGEDNGVPREPLQVHRIPLRPVLASTVNPDLPPATTPFYWGGLLPEGFSPQILTFTAGQTGMEEMAVPGLSRFLIPLLRSSYRPEARHFIGVDMTDMLVNEIARLVNEYEVEMGDIGLLAEQEENGDYYLRLFPENSMADLGMNNP